MSDDGWGGVGEDYSKTRKTNETNDTQETNEVNQSSETTETNESGETSGTINIKDEWNGRTIYLPDSDVNELDVRYEELNLESKRETGEGIHKSREFYPAVIQAALNNTTIEKELGL